MRMPILAIVCSCLLAACASSPIIGNSVSVTNQGDFLIHSESSTSAIQMPASNFNLVYSNSADRGRYRYYIFGNPQNFIISFTIESALSCTTNTKCRDQHLVGLEKYVRVSRDFKRYEKDDAAIFEFFLPTFENVTVNQQNLFASFVKDGYGFYIHVSKMEFSQKDKELFDEIFESIEFMKSPEKGASPESTSIRHFPIPDHGVLVPTYISKRTYVSGELISHNVSSIQRERPLRYGQQ
jgi:hypothetical protein